MSDLPLAIAPGDPDHIEHHETMHALLEPIRVAGFDVAAISNDTLANRPAAADAVDMWYFANDVPALTYSDGSTWRAAVLNTTTNTWTAPQQFDDDALFGSGRPWVDVMEDQYGATGDGVTDDFVAVDAAVATGARIIFFGEGTFLLTGRLDMVTNDQQLWGSGEFITKLKNATTDVLGIATAGTTVRRGVVRDLTIHSAVGGGHCILALGGVSSWSFERVHCDQDNAAQSIYEHDDPTAIYIGNMWLQCGMTHEPTASVPGFNIVTSGSAANHNLWKMVTFTYSGQFAFHVECTSGTAWNLNNHWQECVFEITNGGNIRLLTAADCSIVNCGTYDLVGATTQHLYYLGTGGGALDSRGIRMENAGRFGGTLGVGMQDIFCQAGGATTSGIIIDSCINRGGTAYAISCGSRNMELRGSSAGGSVTVTLPGSAITRTKSNGFSVGAPAANPDTAGATLLQLETEVNELKALLRTVGFMT